MLLALLFGNEFPQHPQQAGVIDPYVDVAGVVRGKHAGRCVPLTRFDIERSLHLCVQT